MKKAVFRSIMALVVVLGLTLSMAAPVAAASVNMVAEVDLAFTTQKGTLHYEITLTNTGDAQGSYNVTFYPPGPTGAVDEYGDPVPIDTNRTIAVGETVIYTWDGEGVSEARPQLKVELPLIPIDDDVGVVYAFVEFDAGTGGDGERQLPTVVYWPNTEVGIEAPATTVYSGASVTLTITEANTGEEDLTDVYVEVWKNGVLFADLDETHASWSSDINIDNVLDIGETWSWTIDSGPITSATEFVALGFGTAPHDLEVKYAEGFEGERAEVTIQVDAPVGGVASPVSRLALLVPWIVLAGLVAGAAVFVWSRRAQGRA